MRPPPFNRSSLLATIALALAGCGESPPPIVTEDQATAAAAATPTPAPAPPTTAVVPDMTSYEVAIAIAAANRKRAELACDTLPEADREKCHSGVSADWEVTQTALEDLRGEQQ